MKVKSESEVAQSCPTLSGPNDCSLPGFSIHGIFQARVQSGLPLPSPDEGLAFSNQFNKQLLNYYDESAPCVVSLEVKRY